MLSELLSLSILLSLLVLILVVMEYALGEAKAAYDRFDAAAS